MLKKEKEKKTPKNTNHTLKLRIDKKINKHRGIKEFLHCLAL